MLAKVIADLTQITHDLASIMGDLGQIPTAPAWGPLWGLWECPKTLSFLPRVVLVVTTWVHSLAMVILQVYRVAHKNWWSMQNRFARPNPPNAQQRVKVRLGRGKGCGTNFGCMAQTKRVLLQGPIAHHKPKAHLCFVWWKLCQ